MVDPRWSMTEIYARVVASFYIIWYEGIDKWINCG